MKSQRQIINEKRGEYTRMRRTRYLRSIRQGFDRRSMRKRSSMFDLKKIFDKVRAEQKQYQAPHKPGILQRVRRALNF